MIPHFVICSPVYNAELFVEGSVRSALNQVTTAPLRWIFLDDASTDHSGEIRRRIAKEPEFKDKAITVVSNPIRRGATYNYWQIAKSCGKDEIMIILDGDDQLAHPFVVDYLAKVYRDPNIWATYGQFRYDQVSGGGEGMAGPLPDDNHTRKAGWRTTHLKTCLAGLMAMIPEAELIDPETGDFWERTGDLALFYPVIEQAGPLRCRFIPDILYIYNMQNPISDFRVDQPRQKAIAEIIEARDPYPVLHKIPWEGSPR